MERPSYLKDTTRNNSIFKKGSRLVYGTSGLGGVWGKVKEDESIDCLLYALEHGITSLDTSPSYNRAEEYLGKALRRWRGEQPFISTKIGRLPAEKANECYVDYSAESMRRSLMISLEKLGVDQVDLLFLHEPQLVPIERIEEILEVLLSFKAEGYTKMLGVGGNPVDVFRPYITRDNFQVVSGFLRMDACNLSAFEKDIPHIQQHDIAYYAASALHMSLLGNSCEISIQKPSDIEWITHRDLETAKAINEIAKRNSMKLSTLAQRYLFSIKEADRVVMGARKIEQIQSTVEDWQAGALPESIFNTVTKTILEIKNK